MKDPRPLILKLRRLAKLESTVEKRLTELHSVMNGGCDVLNNDAGEKCLTVTPLIRATGSLEAGWTVQVGSLETIPVKFAVGQRPDSERPTLGWCHIGREPSVFLDLVMMDGGPQWDGEPMKWVDRIKEMFWPVIEVTADTALRKLRPQGHE